MSVLADTGLHPFDYAIIALYMLVMLGIGFKLSKTQNTSEEFFVGERQMPWWAVGMSMIATLMSTLTYLGGPGEIILHGMSITLALIGTPIAFLVVGYLWVPFFMQLRLTSAYEYLDLRFGSGTRWLAVIIYLYMRFIWMGAIIFTASVAIAQMTQATAPGALATLSGGKINIDAETWLYVVILSNGIITTIYTALGGIKAVIWTDVLQFICLFLGAVATIVVIGVQTGSGPVDWITEVTSSSHQLPPLFSWDLSARTTIVGVILAGVTWNILTHCSDQVALQRYFTTSSAANARKVAAVNYVLDATMQILLGLVGAALLYYYIRHINELPAGVTDPRDPRFSDKIFPHFIEHGLPIGISGLVIAAIFAVAQSSLDSGINSTTTVIVVDIIRKRKPLTDREELRTAQTLTVIIGTLITVVGVLFTRYPQNQNIIDLQMKSFNCVLGPLGAIFMAGILLPHVGGKTALISGFLGLICGLIMGYIDVVAAQFQVELATVSPFMLIPVSWLITFTTAALLGGFMPAPRPEQVRGLTWQSVRRGEKHEVIR
ncbi:MAG: sodium:solute symporter family transporter [Planctomycetaceae bacterium]